MPKISSRCYFHSNHGDHYGYGMIVYNVALNMGGVRGETFIAALHEMPIMVPIAFI